MRVKELSADQFQPFDRSVPNEITVEGGVVYLRLHGDRWAILDPIDYPAVQPYRWYAHRAPSKLRENFYVYANAKKGNQRVCIKMHRLIMGCSGAVDHKDGNGLNNRRNNLRHCTATQNRANRFIPRSSGFKGVTHVSRGSKRWRARVVSGGKEVFLKYFATAKQAAHAYDKAARDVFGEFARVNFPEAR